MAGRIIIQHILVKIADDDLQSIAKDLQRLPLITLDENQSDTLLAMFLDEGFKHRKMEATKLIVDFFQQERGRKDPLPVISSIFINPNIDRDVMLFVTDCYKRQPIDYFIDLVNINFHKGDDIAVKIAAVLINLFPNISHDDWKLLFHLTDDESEDEDEENSYPNQKLRCLFQTKMGETILLSKPEWVKDFPKVSLTKLPKLPSVKTAVNLLYNDICKKSDEVNLEKKKNEILQTLISQYSISTYEEKLVMLEPIFEITEEMKKGVDLFKDHFREYGPINSKYSDLDDDVSNCCSKSADCHMLTCKEFENNDNDIFAIDEHMTKIKWFKNTCDYQKCSAYIPKENEHCAIRRPLPNGGWIGCYCSIECLSNDVDPHDKTTLLMIGRMIKQLNEIGIRDR